MTHFCPSCGFNLSSDVTLEIGDWTLDPRGVVSWRNQSVGLTTGEAGVLYAIAKAGGRPVKAEAIGNRISNAEDVDNLVRVFIIRIRKKLKALSIEPPMITDWNRGYRWVAPHNSVEEAA